MPILRLLLAAAVSLLLACQTSQTETAPAAAPASRAADEADASVIPLDEVKPSQSGSVSQTIANTELTITYDRPVARGRELFGGIITVWRDLESWRQQCDGNHAEQGGDHQRKPSYPEG